MGARHKLNQIAIQSCLIAGGIFGLAFKSWLVFVIATAIFTCLSLHGGEIRPNSGERTGMSQSKGDRTRFPRGGRR